MRLAVFADIHGNLPAFEAALAHARGQNVDQIIIAGDVVNGSPDSAACWQLAHSLGCPIVRGNHERYLVDFGTERADPIWNTAQFAPVQWSVAQFTAAERAAMGALPGSLRLPDLLIVHGSLRSDTDMLRAHTPQAQLPELFPEVTERLIVRAHDHVATIYMWGSRRVITTGSVGLPLNGLTTAQYLLLEQRPAGWHAAHQSVPYDLDAALARYHASGYLAATGVMGRLLFRELATASFHVVPFLRLAYSGAPQGPIDLDAAFARYQAL